MILWYVYHYYQTGNALYNIGTSGMHLNQTANNTYEQAVQCANTGSTKACTNAESSLQNLVPATANAAKSTVGVCTGSYTQ